MPNINHPRRRRDWNYFFFLGESRDWNIGLRIILKNTLLENDKTINFSDIFFFHPNDEEIGFLFFYFFENQEIEILIYELF